MRARSKHGMLQRSPKTNTVAVMSIVEVRLAAAYNAVSLSRGGTHVWQWPRHWPMTHEADGNLYACGGCEDLDVEIQKRIIGGIFPSASVCVRACAAAWRAARARALRRLSTSAFPSRSWNAHGQ